MKLLHQLIIILSLLFFVMSCGSDKTNEVSEYDELKYTATEFSESLFYKDFERAELFCDNASKGSVRKLANFQFDFRSIYFKEIDTCIITKKTAECICMYNNYDELYFEQTLQLKKIDGSWLVHFILDENFDNIFLYNYETEFFDEDEKWAQQPLDSADKSYFKNILAQLNSNKLVVGYTTENDLKYLDETIKDESDYFAESKYESNAVYINTMYLKKDGIIDEATIDVTSTSEMEIESYYKDILTVLVNEFGSPYNLKDMPEKDFYTAKNVRWFVKGFNEVMEVTCREGIIELSLKKAI